MGNKYPVKECVWWYIEYLRNFNQNYIENPYKEQELILKIESMQLKQQKDLNELIYYKEVKNAFGIVLAEFLQAFIAIPGRLCNDLVGKNAGEIKVFLDKELRDVMKRLKKQLETISEEELSD